MALNQKSRNSLALPDGFLLNNQYVLDRVLGQGGFGITYAAWDEIHKRKVAIKEYFPLDIASRGKDFQVTVSKQEDQELYEYGIGRFNDEANALVHFNRHPGIVAVYDLFDENGSVYMAMQFLEGKTWMELLAEQGEKIAVTHALSIFIPVLDSLRAIHEAGMLHRDISPDNIVILPNKQVKLIDFGAARYAMKEQQVFSIIFKPGYTPEEQYRSSGKIGPWTDLYALAASFYHAITGTVPRDAMNRLEIDTLLPPSKLRTALPAKMEETLLKALSVKSEERFQSVDELKTALIASIKDGNVHKTKKTPIWVWVVAAGAVIDFVFIILLLVL